MYAIVPPGIGVGARLSKSGTWVITAKSNSERICFLSLMFFRKDNQRSIELIVGPLAFAIGWLINTGD